MNELLLKYNQLDDVSKITALNFIDYLFEKKANSSLDLSDYKKKILNVSTWSEEDFTEFENNRKIFDNWTVEQW